MVSRFNFGKNQKEREMKNSFSYVAVGALAFSLAGNVWLGKELSAAKDEIVRQRAKIRELQAETERLDREIWKIGRGLDFCKPFGVEPGALIDQASLEAKFMDTEGGYVGFKPADIVGEKDSKRIAEVSGFLDRTFKTKDEAEKAAGALKTWMAFWMEGSDLGWKVEVNDPEPGWDWRVRFRVEQRELAEIIRKREK